MNYKKYIREKSGKNRCDLTLLMGDYEVFSNLIKDMTRPFNTFRIDKVAALEATGFALGAGVASDLKAGLVLTRKADKIAWSAKSSDFTDYTNEKKVFEIADDAIKPDENILIVDDWSETGAQLKAAISLIEQLGGNIIGVTCINIDDRVKKDKLLSKYKLHSTIQY